MNQKQRLSLLAIVITLILVGCTSGYKEFYKPTPGADPKTIAKIRVSPPQATPIVERSPPGDNKNILDSYAKRGYVMIGNSMFNSNRQETEESAINQGKEIGADLVLILNPQYSGSVTSSIPITTPTTSTSYSTGSATAYGAGGTVNAYGSGLTTTYGSTTNYIPITIHRSDYGAIFFIKKKWSFGIHTRDLSDTERQELQTNKGAVVDLVVDNTPAFEADILIGDVIKAIDTISVSNTNTLLDLSDKRRGKMISLSILRHGQSMEKSVKLNP